MQNDSQPYLFLAIFFGMALVFPLAPLILARVWSHFFSPPKPGADKLATYECGLESKGDPIVRFRAGYYLYAILFLVFDVEAAFLLPIGVAFLELPVAACVAVLIFVLLLLEGLVWAWKKGVLDWK